MSDRIDELTRAAEDRWKAGWRAGPSRLRWTTLPPQVGDPAPDGTLPSRRPAAAALGVLG